MLTTEWKVEDVGKKERKIKEEKERKISRKSVKQRKKHEMEKKSQIMELT